MTLFGKKDEAFVLCKRYGYYSLLSKTRGHFDAYLINLAQSTVISPGMRISYVMGQRRGHRYWVHDCVIEDSPLLFGRYDIIFLHSLLELVAYYGTSADVYKELYVFFETLCARNAFALTPLMKKTVICSLFAHLGLFPDQTDYVDYRFFLTLSIDKIDTIDLKLVDESFLERWIVWNITHYPQGQWVKVLPYIVKK